MVVHIFFEKKKKAWFILVSEPPAGNAVWTAPSKVSLLCGVEVVLATTQWNVNDEEFTDVCYWQT